MRNVASPYFVIAKLPSARGHLLRRQHSNSYRYCSKKNGLILLGVLFFICYKCLYWGYKYRMFQKGARDQTVPPV